VEKAEALEPERIEELTLNLDFTKGGYG